MPAQPDIAAARAMHTLARSLGLLADSTAFDSLDGVARSSWLLIAKEGWSGAAAEMGVVADPDDFPGMAREVAGLE